MMNEVFRTASIVAIALYLSQSVAHADGFGATGNTIPFFVNGGTTPGGTPVGTLTQNGLTITGGVVAGAASGTNTNNWATVIANGGVQLGNDWSGCGAAQAGTMRWNQVLSSFEGCNGTSWQAIGGGGNTLIAGGCQTYWSSCPGGYHPTSYFSPGTYNCCDRCGNPAWRYTVCSQ